MFLSVREIRRAGGRFFLIGAVTVFITLLLVMLTGLTQGLGSRNTSALESFSKQQVVFSDPFADVTEVNYTDSAISEQRLSELEKAGGELLPLGIGQTRAVAAGGAEPVGVFGVPEGTEVLDSSIGSRAAIPAAVAEKLDLEVGDPITLGSLDTRVGAVVEDTYYSHMPVVWVSTEAWQQVAHTDDVATVAIAPSLPEGFAEDTNTAVTSVKGSFKGLSAYNSEQASLRSMQGFLYAISALVTVAFLTIWTMQRTRDIAVLRVLGASPKYVLIDALAQSAIVLGGGTLLGALLGLGLGAAVQTAVPFALGASTVLLPAVGVFLLGMIASTFAVRKTATVDPQVALAA